MVIWKIIIYWISNNKNSKLKKNKIKFKTILIILIVIKEIKIYINYFYTYIYKDSEQGLISLYEFFYSCRDSYNSTYPEPQDKSFVESLNLLKKLKKEVASSTYNIKNSYYILRFYI